MVRILSAAVTIAFAMTALVEAVRAEPADEGACRVLSRGTDSGSLRDLFAMHRRTLVLLADTVLLCDCAPPRLLGTDDEARRIDADDEARRIAADDERRRGGEDSEGRRLGGDTESRHAGGDAEARRLGSDDERRSSGADAESRRLGGDDENRRAGADGERRRTGGDSEVRRGGGDDERRAIAGDTEGRRLGGDDGMLTCRKEPGCEGFIVSGIAPLRLFDGTGVRDASGRCIP